MENERMTPPETGTGRPGEPQLAPMLPPRDRRRERREWRFVLVILLAVIAGFLGGAVSPFLNADLVSRIEALRKVEKKPAVGDSGVMQVLSTDDEAIVKLVAERSPAVVSIVISKDIPQVRSFSQDPFGGAPFFFDPFNNGGRSQGQGQGSATEKRQIGSGSGFFVSEDGLIVTNKHVVSDERAEYTVVTTDGKEYPVTVLARDPNNDIAVMKVEGSGFPKLALGNSDDVKVGQTAIVIGNPLGEFANSVSRGIISGVKRDIQAGGSFGESEQLLGILQTDAAINPGNSGGPLFNISGEVIGVNVAMAGGAENIGFALPANQVAKIVEQVRTTGKISTPYIGVRYLLLNDALQKENSLPFNYGALVLRGERMTDFAVIPGSPADKAGIVENDIILEVNGKKVDEKNPLPALIGQSNVGDDVTLKVWHKGETKDVKVKLEERR